MSLHVLERRASRAFIASTEPSPRAALRVAVAVSFTTAVLAVITLAMAVSTPPLSGPFCTAGCYTYPFPDIAPRYPRDYVWMYPAMLLTLAYVALLACIHELAQADKRLFTIFGLSAGVMSAITLIADYFVQLTVLPPSVLAGETDGVAMLTQFNAHGVFIALEELGYILMGISFLCVARVFGKRDRSSRWLRWLFDGGFWAIVIALIAISISYGVQREYRFEVAVIVIDWLVLGGASLVLGLKLRRQISARATEDGRTTELP